MTTLAVGISGNSMSSSQAATKQNTQFLSVLMTDDISAKIKEQSSVTHNIQQKHPYIKSMTHQTWPNRSNTGAVMMVKIK